MGFGLFLAFDGCRRNFRFRFRGGAVAQENNNPPRIIINEKAKPSVKNWLNVFIYLKLGRDEKKFSKDVLKNFVILRILEVFSKFGWCRRGFWSIFARAIASKIH